MVSTERGMQLAEQLGVEFYETSAKENIYVKVRCILGYSQFFLCLQTVRICPLKVN